MVWLDSGRDKAAANIASDCCDGDYNDVETSRTLWLVVVTVISAIVIAKMIRTIRRPLLDF